MHKDDLAEILENGLVTTGDSIVNPRCDTCGTRLGTPTPSEIGMPRLCTLCTMRLEKDMRIMSKDWISQERPRGRSVHVVKLPEGMK